MYLSVELQVFSEGILFVSSEFFLWLVQLKTLSVKQNQIDFLLLSYVHEYVDTMLNSLYDIIIV